MNRPNGTDRCIVCGKSLKVLKKGGLHKHLCLNRYSHGARRAPRLNRYTCGACGTSYITRDVDEGTTPMLLSHGYAAHLAGAATECKGQMMSAWYRVDGDPPIDFEWFKPKRLKGYSRDMKDHIRRGGLVIRKAAQR